jgi:hypothetical protein
MKAGVDRGLFLNLNIWTGNETANGQEKGAYSIEQALNF